MNIESWWVHEKTNKTSILQAQIERTVYPEPNNRRAFGKDKDLWVTLQAVREGVEIMKVDIEVWEQHRAKKDGTILEITPVERHNQFIEFGKIKAEEGEAKKMVNEWPRLQKFSNGLLITYKKTPKQNHVAMIYSRR